LCQTRDQYIPENKSYAPNELYFDNFQTSPHRLTFNLLIFCLLESFTKTSLTPSKMVTLIHQFFVTPVKSNVQQWIMLDIQTLNEQEMQINIRRKSW
jgi:hypothetical protein